MNLNKQTLSAQIYEILKNDILTQTIPCGSKLTLKILQERFGVSSTPIREALTRLTEEHLISYYSNVGVKVVNLEEQDIQEIYQFMGDLDALAVRYSVSHPQQDELLFRLKDNLDHMHHSQQDPSLWKQYSDQFHLLFYDYCQNSRLVRSAEKIRSQLSILAYQYENQEAKQLHILEEHRRIYQRYASGNYEDAVCLMKEHLQHSLTYALEIIRHP